MRETNSDSEFEDEAGTGAKVASGKRFLTGLVSMKYRL